MRPRYFQHSLRNRNIDYRHGRFFVTVQVAHNKCLLGAIVGEKCVLNELGQGVRTVLEGLPVKYEELALGAYVIMPNHIHAIFDIKPRVTNKENHLGFLVGRFKGASSFLYSKLKRTGRVADIGEHLWQLDYWDDLIASDEEYRGYESYIQNNPRNWTCERWGAVTQYMLGEAALLDFPKRAFVASQGYGAGDFSPRRISLSEHGTLVPLPADSVLISTFASAQERAVLMRALAKKRRIIHVCPQGIPEVKSLPAEQQLALAENRLLLISPQPGGSPLNKKVATWCNEYVLRQAGEIWAGDIAPNGMLSALIANLQQEARG